MGFKDYCLQLEQRDIDKREKIFLKQLDKQYLESGLIECNVCMDKIQTYGLINCGHIFCFPCICQWKEETNKCPLCKEKFNVIKKIEGQQVEYEHV